VSPAPQRGLAGFTLRELGFGARVSASALVLVFFVGLAASGYHLVEHHQNRDEQPGVSMVDLEGAYHGVQTTSLLLEALERGHPSELAAGERTLLVNWLKGSRISEDYDSLELGDAAPAELLAARCMACHSRAAVQGEHKDARVALEYWEDVSRVAFSKRVEPVPVKVLAASTHAHALSLAAMSAVIGALLLATRFGAGLRNGLCAVAGLALLADLAGWWLARSSPAWTAMIAVAGGAYALSTAVSLLLILAELWLPRRD
jgi:hypothetical protein